MSDKIYKYLLITLRGLGMGAADIIPGVSGGTIALITGIYEKLILSLKAINPNTLKIVYKEGIASAWKKINGNFLISLFTGILISIFTLARLISWLMINHKVLVWAFFFGLITASAIYIWKKIDGQKLLSLVFLILGTAISFYITLATPATTPDSLLFTFIAGCIAICAMILPGISGSFILLLMGKYEFILQAVNDFKIEVLAVFAAGCAVGLISFANVISWLFKKIPNITLALLTGFMLGSLNKLWPWKEVVETMTSSSGEIVPMIEKNISPAAYQQIENADPLIFPVILVALAGFIIVFLIEYLAAKKENKKTS
jgi:putative membrane protein